MIKPEREKKIRKFKKMKKALQKEHGYLGKNDSLQKVKRILRRLRKKD